MCPEEDKLQIVDEVKRLFAIINNQSCKRDLDETMEETTNLQLTQMEMWISQKQLPMWVHSREAPEC